MSELSENSAIAPSPKTIDECVASFATVGEADKQVTAKAFKEKLTKEIVQAESPEKLETLLAQLFRMQDTAAFTIADGIIAHFQKKKHGPIAENLLHIMLDNPIPTSQLTIDVLDSVQEVTENLKKCIPKEKYPSEKIWELLCKTPAKFYNAVLGEQYYLSPVHTLSSQQKLNCIKLLEIFLENFNNLPEEERFQLSDQFEEYFSGFTFEGKPELEENMKDVVAKVFDKCLACGVRDAWVVAKTDQNGEGIYTMQLELDKGYEQFAKGEPGFVDPCDRKITRNNLSVQETILNTILETFNCGENKKLSLALFQSNSYWMLERLESTGNKCCAQLRNDFSNHSNRAIGEQNRCECQFDCITRNVWEYFTDLTLYWESIISDPSIVNRITEVILSHPTNARIASLKSLESKFPEYLAPYLDQIVEFLFGNGNTDVGQRDFEFLVKIALYDPENLKPFYVDYCEKFLIKEIGTRDCVEHSLNALDKIAVNAPQLMAGRGEGYYEASLRTDVCEHTVAWEKIDNTIKCIALLSAAEAERCVNILIGGTQLIPAMTHRANVLEHLACIAIVYPQVVKKHTKWIDQQGAVDFLKKSVVRLNLILTHSAETSKVGNDYKKGGVGKKKKDKNEKSSMCIIN